MMVRSYNPAYWTDFIWNLTPHRREEKIVIDRMHKFTHKLILGRLEEFKQMNSQEILKIRKVLKANIRTRGAAARAVVGKDLQKLSIFSRQSKKEISPSGYDDLCSGPE